jgi:hypothetical protein
MAKIHRLNSRGIAHIGLVVASVLVCGVVSFAAWQVMRADINKDETVNSQQNDQNASESSQPSNKCAASGPGLFTKDITDISAISLIQNPIRVIGGNNIKTHSFIEVRQKSPVYAPMDSTLTGGANYYETMGSKPVTKVQYLLALGNGCNINYWVDHLVDVPDNIKEAFPSEARNDTQSANVKLLKIKAGDLLGYTNQSGAARFDFGVMDLNGPETILTTDSRFKDNEIVKTSDKYRHAVCPYQFFDAAKTKQYVSLFEARPDPDQEIIDNLCKAL